MKKVWFCLACWLALTGSGGKSVGPWPETALRGFLPARAAQEEDFEKAFRSVPTSKLAEQDLRILTRTPHVAGTPEDYETAQYVLAQFRQAGMDAQVVEYQALLPMPKEVKVDLVGPFRREGPTPEGGWSGAEGGSDDRVVPAFNAYSPSGEVTAPVVYANYGLPEDYLHLKESGIDVAGKIVIVRYGKCFRGVKAYVAEERHAAGLLIYSDPSDDGYRQGDVFPRGPWRPATGVQRGSILYLTAYAGDPLTPGVAATKEAKRLSLQDAPTLPHIPTTPLSYGDASPIIENLDGPVAPREWQGALPFTYHLGPGASKVHLKLEMDFQVRPIWDVIGQIPGDTQPDSWVVLGNHRDAWTYGAADPNSGTAPLLAVGRGLGQLLKQGWKPQRTIVLASWDAEEFGLIGSTEWAEEHAEGLTRHAVAYLNMDIGVCGPHFGAAAVPSLRALIRDVSKEVNDPNSGRQLYAVWSEESGKFQRENGIPIVVPTHASLPSPGKVRIGDLGSGSDYTPFLEHLGVPALDLGFGGAYGVYHAAFDNFYWMQTFGDPSFKYSVAAAQVFGTLALRLAGADILPFDYEEYGEAIQNYLRELQEEIKPNDPGAKLGFQDATSAALKFTAAAKTLGQKVEELSRGGDPDLARLVLVNRALLQVERDFLLPQGLPNRRWFRHAFYAPGVYTGYAAAIMPGVREALARKDWNAAAQQVDLIKIVIDRGTATLTGAIEILGGADTPPGRRVEAGH